MEVIVAFEGRSKIFKCKRGATEKDVRAMFEKLCQTDPVLRKRITTHYPTFTTRSARHGIDVELEPGEKLIDGQTVQVFFASYAAVVSRTLQVPIFY